MMPNPVMNVASVVAPGELGLTKAVIPSPGPNEVLVRVDRVGICGSDLHLLPIAPQGGVIGHEFVGTVSALGANVSKLVVGDRVCSMPCISCGRCQHCLSGNPIQCEQVRYHGSGEEAGMGGFGEYVLAGGAECIKLPERISISTAALIEPIAVGLHLFERAKVGVDEHLVILGAGPIGLTVVLWARSMGVTKILVSDPVAARRDIALAMGATAVVDPIEEDLAEACQSIWDCLPEVIIECMGRAGRFDIATSTIRRGGRVVIGGMMFESETIDSMTPFMKNISVEYVIQYEMKHFYHTVNMLEQGRIDPTPMISAEISLNELPAMMQTLLKPNELCKVLVAPGTIK